MSAKDVTVPPEFDEVGIKPLAYGQPELAKATSYAALARQIERDGVKDEAGTELARPDTAGAQALARQFADPRTTGIALKVPLFKHLQAGTVALVHSQVLMTRVNPSLLNPRVAPLMAIPDADSNGRVAFSWAPEDVSEDPDALERLMQTCGSIDELTQSSRETADKVLALQRVLADMIGREGVEEPLLIVMTQLIVDGPIEPARAIVPVCADGGSRGTICQEFLADAVEALITDPTRGYATKHKRRKGLEELERALRVHQPATLIDDPIAERELRDYLVDLSRRPAAELVKNGLYAAQRSLVAPAMVVVGFRPNGSATIIDAIDQLVGNQHKRGPLQWEVAARALDSRNSVLRTLRRQGVIGEAKALHLGPKYEEAYSVWGVRADPDFRIAEAVRVFHAQFTRRPLREAFGSPQSKLADRCEVIAAVIGEQIRDADPGFRRNIDTTLRDMLGHPPFYGSDVPELPGRGNHPDPDTLVADVKKREEKNPKKLSVAHVELGVRGGVALVLLGALAREHGALASEAARPYTVLQRMLHDPMGQEILGEAIKALRAADSSIPARDPETGKPIGRDAENRVVPMTPANTRELFTGSGSGGGGGSADNADDLITEMKNIARNKLGDLLSRLRRVPDVAKQGVAPHKVADLTDLLMEQAGDLDYLGRKGADHLSASEEELAEAEVPA